MKHPLVILLVLLSACASKVVAPEPSAPVLTAPLPSEVFPSINYNPIYAQDRELEFIHKGQQEANTVLADPCFKERWMLAKLTENKNLTNAQIYQMFLDHSPLSVGIEMFTGGIKEKLNHTVAYEGDPISMNRNYVVNSTYIASASLHEGFGHGLGFTHYTPKMNPNSIPYTLNSIYEYCAKKLGIKVSY